MPYTINDLRRTWAENANDYQNKEIGGGVHNFINMALQCPELFGLKLKPKRSTMPFSYTHDTEGAPNGRPDFVIYIDKEIAIPVEAKRYTHINEGEKQLFRYQLDWCQNARYGILTDGYTWRFYNNTASRELNLDDLLNTPQKFTDFWQDYTKPEKYYLSFFEPQMQDNLFSQEESINVENNRGIFFDDITKLIDKFKNKLDLAGYFTDLEPKERQKKATELSYAYLIQFILYKTLVDNAYAAFSDEFALRTEQIYRALKARSYSAVLNQISGISNTISQHIYRPFSSEQSLIEQKIRNVLMLPQQEISDISLWLDIIIFIRRYDFSSIKNDIFGFIYENYLKDLYEEQQKGQYFTDPAVVNFMLDEIGFTTNYIRGEYQNFRNSKNKEIRLSLIDPSCGSGTFLYSAVDRIIDALDDNSENMSMFIKNLVNGNIFGLDIAEFPLYLAEMSILMRMLPLIVNQRYNNPVDKKIKVFKTNDSISEFMDTGIIAGDIVRAKNENQLDFFSERQDLGYQSYIRDEDDLREMKTSLQKRTRFDFVIGNPPYIGYNECCRQKALFTELIRERKMFMNNIYGINLHSIPGHPKKSPPKPNLYAFFMALGLGLLKDKGVISYIIPQTLLNAEAFDVLRYHLAKFTTIDKIITFAGNMFIGRGIHQNKPVATSSLIFVVRRKKPSARHKVKVIRYQNYDNDGSLGAYLSSERKTTASVLQSELLKKAGNWNFLQYLGNLGIIKFCQQYEKNAGLSQYYNHDEAQQEFNSAFYFDIGYNIDESNLSPQEDGFLYPKINEQFYNILQARGYYPEDRPIKLLKNNQGLKLLNSRCKILWSYNNPRKFHFTDQKVIWARNSICGIGSNNHEELLYLFALLNAPVNIAILNLKLRNPNEKALLVSLQAIRQYIKAPKITKTNLPLKKEIISQTQKLLNMEKVFLKDIVDFSAIGIQKFDSVAVEDCKLLLSNGSRHFELNIPPAQAPVVVSALNAAFVKDGKPLFEQISLTELKYLCCIDTTAQNKLKEYIDDLVFALYFNIRIGKPDFSQAEKIHQTCARNPHYALPLSIASRHNIL